MRVAEEALQLHGGYGFIGDYNIERFYRDCKIVEIYEGTKEIEKTIIARELLGKYLRLTFKERMRRIMDFELTNRQKQIRLAAREFAEGELVPIGKECETKGEFPRDIIKKAAQLGFIGVYIKKEYGGLGLGLLEHAIILEEFWRAEPGLAQVSCPNCVWFGYIVALWHRGAEEEVSPPFSQRGLGHGFFDHRAGGRKRCSFCDHHRGKSRR